MRQQLLDPEESMQPESVSRRQFPQLRGGQDDQAPIIFCGGFVTFLVLAWGMFIAALSPNEFGILRNTFTGRISYQVQRGGIHLTGPLQTFVTFPAAQVTLEFSQSSLQRPAVQTRTGADPHDPDSGGQPIAISCALQIQFVPETLRSVYLSFGSRQAAIQRYILLAGNMVGNAAQEFTPQDFWTRRDGIAARMLHKINGTLWHQGSVVALRFEILKVDFAQQFEDSITAVQVAEQQKVVSEYEQQVQEVVQAIEILKSENQAVMANITAGADADAKEIMAGARRDAFNLKQGMKAKKYSQLQRKLGFTLEQMSEYFKIKSVQGTGRSGKVVIGIPAVGDIPAAAAVSPVAAKPARAGPS